MDEVFRTIELNRPLAFLMEESDGVATYAGGKWWQARVAELEAMGYHVKWCILNAAQRGVPQNRPRLLAVGLRWDCRGQPANFCMPEALPPEMRMDLAAILAPRTAQGDLEALPRA